jgi:hypothetical protein
MEKELKVFYAEHAGIWLGGFSIVAAASAEAALELVNAELVRNGLKPDAQVTEFDVSKPHARVIWNGDY